MGLLRVDTVQHADAIRLVGRERMTRPDAHRKVIYPEGEAPADIFGIYRVVQQQEDPDIGPADPGTLPGDPYVLGYGQIRSLTGELIDETQQIWHLKYPDDDSDKATVIKCLNPLKRSYQKDEYVIAYKSQWDDKVYVFPLDPGGGRMRPGVVVDEISARTGTLYDPPPQTPGQGSARLSELDENGLMQWSGQAITAYNWSIHTVPINTWALFGQDPEENWWVIVTDCEEIEEVGMAEEPVLS